MCSRVANNLSCIHLRLAPSLFGPIGRKCVAADYKEWYLFNHIVSPIFAEPGSIGLPCGFLRLLVIIDIWTLGCVIPCTTRIFSCHVTQPERAKLRMMVMGLGLLVCK